MTVNRINLQFETIAKTLILIIWLFWAPQGGQCQTKCGISATPFEEEFEGWIESKALERVSRNARTSADSYSVRVVVHIIHKGEPVGTGTNISDLQIQSQMQILNRDFKRLNPDAVNTPTEFTGVASSMNITFDLVKVNRVRGTKDRWALADNAALKAQSFSPSEDYINIWVCDFVDYYGYSQFPISTLPGLDREVSNRLTDGIIMSYRTFGSNEFGSFSLVTEYSRGRSLVHEMGHFFGLRHLWGDQDTCAGTDYVTDTPAQAGETRGCPTHPQSGCGTYKMFQNYMDFTSDNCMNLFTQGQVARMKIVLENSPRRASLLLPLEKPEEVTFEKIFSPNGDGINDFWRWNNIVKYQGCPVTVYNRFGKEVYKNDSYDNSWDGRNSEGQLLEPEGYYFIIRCTGTEVTGGVRIVR